MEKSQVAVAFSPALFDAYYTENVVIVVIDAIRMSASIITALANGAEEILPVAGLEETLKYKPQGYLIGGERDTYKVEGFDFGNSPESFKTEKVKGQKIALSTTNGTQVLDLIMSKKSSNDRVFIGSFLNARYLAQYIGDLNQNVLIQCSGWKNTICTEDVLAAGYITELLVAAGNHYVWRDSAFLANALYKAASLDLVQYVYDASPRLLSKKDYLHNDILYCLEKDKFSVLPELIGRKIKLTK
jgi:2-phosphosulfolactate phosphatase